MVTIYREAGLRITIFKDDHEPAQVHVHGDGEAKIDLGDSDRGPTLVWSVGLSRAALRRALRIVVARRAEFPARRSAIHGSGDRDQRG